MSTITKEFTKERLEEIAEDGFLKHGESKALARIALASLEAEPVPFDALRDAVAEVSGGPAMEWSDIYKGHQAVPFINFNSLARIVDKFRTAPPVPVEDTEIQRKAAIHDALCEKYNVESLADFVEWQRNHIAELEAAPPAPVGEGETAVMPEYPGYVMTQRECFQAGKKAGMAEAGNSPVIPDGCCIMPKKLTAENGAKGALSGEFHVTNRMVCQSCGGEGCEDCNDEGGWDAEIPVSWDTIKRIHEAAVEACSLPAAPQQEV